MKKYLVIAVSAIALASCSSDAYLGDNVENTKATGEMPLTFSMVTPNMQKDAHTEAATALNGEFIVWGEKDETKDAAAAGKLVFKNYVVQYTTSSANKSNSNVMDWEYVGITPYAETKVSPKAAVTETGKQTIKYWDYGASNYTFTAVSAKPADISGDKVKITKTESGTTVYDKGYTIDVKAGASIGDIYVADRKFIDHGTGTDRTAINAYGGVAQLTFRKLAAKIRFAIYETVPGHKVTIDQVRYNNVDQTANFGVDGSFIIPGDNTSFTVTYGNGSSTGPANKAITAVAGSSAKQTYFETAGSPLMTADPIATSSATPTYDRALGAYTEILPNTSNATDITLDIDYTITSTDGSGEVITIENATAVIPAAYCKWQSNYAYTYIFKISDNTNGNTGTIGDPRGLYPITFDALVTNTENGNQEVITTVSEPSITTLAVKPGGEIRTGGSEYAANDTIYASVEDNGSPVTLDITKNTKLYTVTTDNVDNFPITEAAVAQRLATGPVGSHLTCTAVTSDKDAAPYYATIADVPSEQGTTGTRRTLSAIKWIGAASTTYAVEYIKISSTTLAIGTSLVGYYTDAACTTSAAPGGDEIVSDPAKTYYKIDSKTYKIIKVQ